MIIWFYDSIMWDSQLLWGRKNKDCKDSYSQPCLCRPGLSDRDGDCLLKKSPSSFDPILQKPTVSFWDGIISFSHCHTAFPPLPSCCQSELWAAPVCACCTAELYYSWTGKEKSYIGKVWNAVLTEKGSHLSRIIPWQHRLNPFHMA